MASLLTLDQLRAAVIDGRTRNIRYRQNELQSLHLSLRDSVDKIRPAISRDLGGDAKASESEYYLTLNAVSEFYKPLDLSVALENEYLIAKGSDNSSQRVGKGLVIIRPTTHTRFYSIICPLAAAIAAGNCLGDSSLEIDVVLKELLPQALDSDTFGISDHPIEDPSVLASSFLVDQTGSSSTTTLNQLSSNTSARAIAIVDRTADIELAARSIINARFSFQGASAYSPDLVVVNEFVKDDFVAACTWHASRYFASGASPSHPREAEDSVTKHLLKAAEDKGEISVFGSSGFMLASVVDRSSPVTRMKVSGCHLPIMGCTSLVDALMSQRPESTLLAAYIFSDAPTAKFLAQYLEACITFVNQIPVHFLVGPAAPLSPLPTRPGHKYSPEMFSSERPQYISRPSSDFLAIQKLFDGEKKPGSEARLLTEIRKAAVKPLPKTGQPLGYAVGFFEQGILLGGGLFLSVVAPALGYGTFVLGRYAWKAVASMRV
ncbi:unnamed protein product [Diplocarpon coronariae]|uniref:Aldehyde dehydrogenase PutA n=1 Tax=Diplocarpon coronariae TaxID=2795749 RepID=A0A218YTW7_9HELO|nr:aldehyde dehydrogenase PutA [Marssonina coronariae]